MNILGGIVARDTGEIIVAGRQVALRTPIESLQAGIGFVQQELNSLPTMSISENIFIDAFPRKFPGIDYQECNRWSLLLLQRLGCDLDPSAIVGELSVGDRSIGGDRAGFATGSEALDIRSTDVLVVEARAGAAL